LCAAGALTWPDNVIEIFAVLGAQTQQLAFAPRLDQPLVELLVQLQRPQLSRRARRRVGP
jgi:hypothetical protein